MPNDNRVRLAAALTPGIDVSHYQSKIDWPAVAASGIRFAYVKATQGVGYTDPLFVSNVLGAYKAGVPAGAYHFMTADKPVAEQADWFRHVTFGLVGLSLPVAIDVEEHVDAADVLTWLDAADEPHNAVLYCNPTYAQVLTKECRDLTNHNLWVAEYGIEMPRVTPWMEWTFWQHSNTGSVPGISGNCDLDWFNGSPEDLQDLIDSTTKEKAT